MKTDETIGFLVPDFISAFIRGSTDFLKSVLQTLNLQVDLSSQNPKGLKRKLTRRKKSTGSTGFTG